MKIQLIFLVLPSLLSLAKTTSNSQRKYVESLKGSPNIRTPQNLSPNAALTNAVDKNWAQGLYLRAIQIFPVVHSKVFDWFKEDSSGTISFQFHALLGANDKLGSAILYLAIDCDDDDFSGGSYSISVNNPGGATYNVGIPPCRSDFYVEMDIKLAVVLALQSANKNLELKISITPVKKDMPELELDKSYVIVHTA